MFRALVEEAGGAWADDVHDLLELAKSLAVGVRPLSRPRLGGLTPRALRSSPAPAATRPWPPTSARGSGSGCPAGRYTTARLRGLLPDAATVGNPLDYTALIWGDVELLSDIIVTVGDDPSIHRILIFYDQATDAGRGGSWAAVRKGIRLGASRCPVPVMVSSTLPELLHEDAALTFIDAGVPAVAGLRTGLACAAAALAPRGDPVHLREIASATRAAAPLPAAANGSRWLPEHRLRSCFATPRCRS